MFMNLFAVREDCMLIAVSFKSRDCRGRCSDKLAFQQRRRRIYTAAGQDKQRDLPGALASHPHLAIPFPSPVYWGSGV